MEAELSFSEGDSSAESQHVDSVFAHHAEAAGASQALLRALSPRSAPVRTESRSNLSELLALSQAKRQTTVPNRQQPLLSEKEALAREYLVEKRTRESIRGWAVEWARGKHPEKCTSDKAMQNFLKNVRRYAAVLSKKSLGPGMVASSQGADTPNGRRVGGCLSAGVCTTAVPWSKRRRVFGAGGPGTMKCAELGDELFTWFVDSVRNIKGRIPSSLLLEVARLIAQDLREFHSQEIEMGHVAPHVQLVLPALSHSWIRRWRRMHHITWRASCGFEPRQRERGGAS